MWSRSQALYKKKFILELRADDLNLLSGLKPSLKFKISSFKFPAQISVTFKVLVQEFSQMRTVTRYLSIYAALWKNSVTREMIFKSNFLLWIVVELLWFGLQLSFIGVLYLHTDHIGSWTKWQVVMLIGASHFIQQIFQAFFLINCTNLSELIRTGKMDFL